jgi:hypothetical protein
LARTASRAARAEFAGGECNKNFALKQKLCILITILYSTQNRRRERGAIKVLRRFPEPLRIIWAGVMQRQSQFIENIKVFYANGRIRVETGRSLRLAHGLL